MNPGNMPQATNQSECGKITTEKVTVVKGWRHASAMSRYTLEAQEYRMHCKYKLITWLLL